jgi:putative Holliday junction resolvase
MSAAAPMRRRSPLSFLAFDFGTRRVGVAVGNSMLKQAQPLVTVSAMGDARLQAIARLVTNGTRRAGGGRARASRRRAT